MKAFTIWRAYGKVKFVPNRMLHPGAEGEEDQGGKFNKNSGVVNT
jgi:hypothetical protein